MLHKDHATDLSGSNHPLLLTPKYKTLKSRRRVRQLYFCAAALAILFAGGLTGCDHVTAKKFEPMRYNTIDKLRERLKSVAQYGDGGSSLGGIPESIDELMKSDPQKGKSLRDAFLKLDTATDKEVRKKIAQEMVDML